MLAVAPVLVIVVHVLAFAVVGSWCLGRIESLQERVSDATGIGVHLSFAFSKVEVAPWRTQLAWFAQLPLFGVLCVGVMTRRGWRRGLRPYLAGALLMSYQQARDEGKITPKMLGTLETAVTAFEPRANRQMF